MAILRSAPLGVLSILSCLILGTFLVTVGPSPPAAVTSSHYGYHPLQGMLCKTVLFKFKALIKVNVDRKSSSSTQSNPGTYEEVQGGYTFSSNPEVYGEETTGSASSSKPKTYANRGKGSGSSSSSSSRSHIRPNPDSAKSVSASPKSCAAACRKEIKRHRDRLAVLPDICQVVITHERSPAYTTPGRISSDYDWAYTNIQWERVTPTASCRPSCGIDALICDSKGAHVGDQQQARQNTCASPGFTDDFECICSFDLRIRRLLPDTFAFPFPFQHGSFFKKGKKGGFGPCDEEIVFSRLQHGGWQGKSIRIVGRKPCLQKDDADWSPNPRQHILICYFQDPQYSPPSSTLISAEFILGYKHSGLPPFTYM